MSYRRLACSICFVALFLLSHSHLNSADQSASELTSIHQEHGSTASIGSVHKQLRITMKKRMRSVGAGTQGRNNNNGTSLAATSLVPNAVHVSSGLGLTVLLSLLFV
uniref:Uncharacterized protein n=1 Tax=Kalanchoe fedtschenkoi TaxID=63787 RepID=A0A7N0V513_KALFE